LDRKEFDSLNYYGDKSSPFEEKVQKIIKTKPYSDYICDYTFHKARMTPSAMILTIDICSESENDAGPKLSYRD